MRYTKLMLVLLGLAAYALRGGPISSERGK